MIPDADWFFAIGPRSDNEAMATNFYGALRQCDLTEADLILAVETDLSGVGAAVMNRLNESRRWKTLYQLN